MNVKTMNETHKTLNDRATTSLVRHLILNLVKIDFLILIVVFMPD